MLKNKKKTLRKIMSEKKNGAEMCRFFCRKIQGLYFVCITIICGQEVIINIKNLVPENLFKRYETFLYNSPSNKCKTKQQSFIRMKHICKNIRATGHEVNSNT